MSPLLNLILQIKGNASNGRNYQSFEHNGGFMTDGNPITAGLLVGYSFSFGERLNLTPKLGGEIQFEHKRRVSDNNKGLDLLDTAYEEENNPFRENETKSIIRALNNCKILDPACGSGEFPMGILQKMVYLLNKLDFENQYWKELQKEKAIEETKSAYEIEDHDEQKT